MSDRDFILAVAMRSGAGTDSLKAIDQELSRLAEAVKAAGLNDADRGFLFSLADGYLADLAGKARQILNDEASRVIAAAAAAKQAQQTPPADPAASTPPAQ